MQLTDTTLLDYLHDARIIDVGITYEPALKNIVIRCSAHEDCGLEEWEGRMILLSFADVVIANFKVVGAFLGDDFFDSFYEKVSTHIQQDIERMTEVCIRSPKVVCNITLSSGTEIAIACDRIELSIIEPS